ncbi:MAG: Npt1/Npt2 family nucleotide transporter [Rhabdochlamydiaceae bacterium]|nr:Npt1/Npt2 family nucleotide transporter [Candidatus Amphrikana amoebophyrae]
MLKRGFSHVKEEFTSLTKFERLFILFAMLCSFLICIEASITKAVSNSIFLGSYGVDLLPYAWFAVVPLNLIIVSLYNRFLPKIGCFKMLAYSTLLTIGFNFFSAYYLPKFYCLPFILYIWKDIYIMLMFQQLWSVLHTTISMKRAKYLYGMFYGIGGFASMVGCLVPGFFAVQFGTEKLLLVTIPLYCLLIYFYYKMLSIRDKHPEMEQIKFDKQKPSSFRSAINTIVKSKLLIFIMITVVAMQLTSTLLDFKFNSYIMDLFPSKDLRTEYLGRFFSVVNGFNVILQFIGTFTLIHLIGIRRTHFIIPFFLGSLALGMSFFPAFSLIAFSYASIKAIDYSIFGVVKEMLYIPLTNEEKFQAKAVIDIFVYRTAKAFASFLIIGLQFFVIAQLQQKISFSLVVVFFFWLLSVVFLYKPKKATQVVN